MYPFVNCRPGEAKCRIFDPRSDQVNLGIALWPGGTGQIRPIPSFALSARGASAKIGNHCDLLGRRRRYVSNGQETGTKTASYRRILFARQLGSKCFSDSTSDSIGDPQAGGDRLVIDALLAMNQLLRGRVP